MKTMLSLEPSMLTGTRAARPANWLPNLGRMAALLVAALLLAGRAGAQLPLQSVGSPFDIVGFLEKATLDAPGDALAGGTMQVNGQTIVVPRNTILQMPANTVTWQQLFSMAPAPYTNAQTGMALTDIPTPLTTYEITVQGNRVGETYIAGLIFVSQETVNSGQGFINFIDYARSEMRVGGAIGNPATGTRVRINDPIGRFAPKYTLDPRFSIDTENPTVRSETGYPMCFPHFDPTVQADPLCPQSNRPIDPATLFPKTIFEMPPPGPAPGPPVGPNAFLMAPFEVGDYITYAGCRMKDGSQPSAGPLPANGMDGTYIAAHTFIDNMGIFTAAGTRPAYVAINVTIIGVGGLPIQGIPQEAMARTRFEGFSTDSAGVIQLSGMDVNACTSAESDRDWGMIDIDPGPPAAKGVVRGRWRFRPPGKVLLMPAAGIFLPPTRNVRASLPGWDPLNPVMSGNGLITGQYNAPIFTFLFPENLQPGNPLPPHNFIDFPFLVNGTGAFNGTNVGQLAPWPGGTPPPAAACLPVSNQPPTAIAGPNQTTTSGKVVTLDGSASSDPNNLSMAWTWTQTAGELVALQTAFAMQPVFTAPPIVPPATSVTLTFQLLVTNSNGIQSRPAFVNVTVNLPPAGTQAPIANAGVPQTVGSGILAQLDGTASSDPNVPPLPLSFSWVQTGFGGRPAVALSNPATATPTFKMIVPPGAPAVLTFQLTVSNGLLTATKSVNVTVNPVLPPVANAGAAQTVMLRTLVNLNGSLSSDPNGLPLAYSWVQSSGTPVPLAGATTATPSFTSPVAMPPIHPYIFTLRVSNGFFLSPPATVAVDLVSTADVVTITVAEYRTGKGRLTVTATSSVPGGSPVLYLVGYGPNGTDLPIPFIAGNVYTILSPPVPQPLTVTVRSSLGGTATSPLTRVRF